MSQKRGLIRRAAVQRKPVMVNDVSLDPEFFYVKELPLTRSELALPMLIGNRLIGILDLQSDLLNRFTEEDLEVMSNLANQFAIAIENARLYAEQLDTAEQLRQVDTMKSQFMASMSHELRTPLNAILNFTQFVSSGMLGEVNNEQVDVLTKAVRSGKHLLSLINDILDITKIEADMLELFVESDVNLYNELQIVTDTIRGLLHERPIELAVAIEEGLPLIVGDKRRLRQIMLNLASNACKFTAQGQITVIAQRHAEMIRMGIQDTGAGIAPEERDIIFEPFRQAKAGIMEASGTGLGLPISRRLTEIHQGRMWLESELGKGSTFYIEIPIKSAVLLAMMD